MMAGAHVRHRVSPHFSLSSGHLQIEIMAATWRLSISWRPHGDRDHGGHLGHQRPMEMKAEGMNIIIYISSSQLQIIMTPECSNSHQHQNEHHQHDYHLNIPALGDPTPIVEQPKQDHGRN